jgi:ubiquinol-cytochrome c reductase cytochrome b subunit
MSTNITTNNLDSKNIESENIAFKQWLAGLIDGDGYFLLTKNGYNSCEITMDARDKKVLYLIQHKYGGSVKQISNAYAFKYKLRNRAGLIALLKDVNGLIRNPARLLQMNKLCVKFNIELKYADNLTFNNG